MRKPPPKKRNPIEALWCRHCGKTGLRYQGRRNRKQGGFNEVYRCVHCERTSQNPPQQAPKGRAPVLMCRYHDVPVAHLQLWRKVASMPWRVSP